MTIPAAAREKSSYDEYFFSGLRDKAMHDLGVGTAKGSPIKMPDGRNLTDNTGETVISRLNEEMCKDIAKAGSGTYIHVDNTSQAQQKLEDEISKMQKGETETVIYSEYDEQFQAIALLALLFLIIETIVRESINPRLKNLRIFKRKTDLLNRNHHA